MRLRRPRCRLPSSVQTSVLLLSTVLIAVADRQFMGMAHGQGFTDVSAHLIAKTTVADKVEHSELVSSPAPFSTSVEVSELYIAPCDTLFQSSLSGSATARAFATDRMLGIYLDVNTHVEITSWCDISVSADATASGTLTATAAGPVYETTYAKSWDWSTTLTENQIPGTSDGVFQALSRGFSIEAIMIPGFGTSQRAMHIWSVGAPAGSELAPFSPWFVQGQVQQFFQPTSADATDLRFQSPEVELELATGFVLEGPGNPFTAFRFPEVPAGADQQFTLQLGDTWIAGLAGETVNLRQYAPNGFSALSLRGDLTPFLPVPPDAAIPIGDEPPRLTFGLAFAQPGIASFTLRPVPEPAAWSLALLAVLGFGAILRPSSYKSRRF